MPARVTRLAAPIAAINLTVKPLNTIIIPQVKALAVVLVLDLELGSTVSVELGLGTHALGLAGGEVAGEHAAVASAGEIDPALDLGLVHAPAPGEAASHSDFCVDGGDDSQSDGGGDLHGGRYVLGCVAECVGRKDG